MLFNIASVRQDFPALSQSVNNHPLVYLDSAASAQKPLQVIEKESEFTLHQYAAVHRGIHTLSANATTMMEEVRQKAALSFTQLQMKKSCLLKAQRKVLTLLQIVLVESISMKGTILSSLKWSTMRILYLGIC